MNKKIIAIRQVILIALAGILIFLDQWTKSIAVDKLCGKPGVQFLGDFLVWQYAENEGAAFSMLEGKQWFLTALSIIILLVIVFFYEVSSAGKRYIPLRICYILIIAGAIGNMIDRIKLNYVRDFIYVKIINFPIFNVADICVTVACAVMIFMFIFIYKDTDKLTILKKPEAKDND